MNERRARIASELRTSVFGRPRTDNYPCTIDKFILAVLSIPNSSPHSMNRLKRLAAILLSSTEDLEQAHFALEAAGVPVSFADCRNCPNPCEDGKKTDLSVSSDPLNVLHRSRRVSPKNCLYDRHDFRHAGIREAIPSTSPSLVSLA